MATSRRDPEREIWLFLSNVPAIENIAHAKISRGHGILTEQEKALGRLLAGHYAMAITVHQILVTDL